MAGTGEVYEFGPYALDVGERRLWNAGQVVPLAPKAHDVLVALVRRAGTLVTKSELLDLVWRDVSVEEGVLSMKGDLDRHIAESLTHARAAGCPPEQLDDLRRIYGARGRAGIVEFGLRANANGPPFHLALLHGEAGNLDGRFAISTLRSHAAIRRSCISPSHRNGMHCAPMCVFASASKAWDSPLPLLVLSVTLSKAESVREVVR
jgi:hypothetical protein